MMRKEHLNKSYSIGNTVPLLYERKVELYKIIDKNYSTVVSGEWLFKLENVKTGNMKIMSLTELENRCLDNTIVTISEILIALGFLLVVYSLFFLK